jgi:quercetin dioxygenase-like cupin family protein
MKRAVLHQQYEIELKELKEYSTSSKQNSFFELIYIIEGTGLQFVNKNHFHYRKGNLFLLTPQDSIPLLLSSRLHSFF